MDFKTVKNVKEGVVLIKQMAYEEFVVIGPRIHLYPKYDSYQKAIKFALSTWHNFYLKYTDLNGEEKIINYTDDHLELLASPPKAKLLQRGFY